MKVNGQDFVIYSIDTEETIKDRIAADFQTFPKYLYINDGKPLDLDGDNIVIDQLSKIKGSKDVDWKRFWGEGIRTSSPLNFEEDIFKVFIAYNKGLASIGGTFGGAMAGSMSDAARPMMPTSDIEYYKFWDKRKEWKKTFNKKLKEFIERAQRTEHAMANFYNVEERSHQTFVQEKIVFEVSLDTDNRTMIELFDMFKVDVNVPFATVQSYYKILKEFIVPEDWKISIDDVIILKVVTGTKIRSKEKIYSDVLMYQEEGITKLLINIVSSIDTDEFINTILSHFEIPVVMVSKEIKEISGVVLFPSIYVNKTLLSDIIMNDYIVKNIFYSDDSTRPKKESNIGRVIYNPSDNILVTSNVVGKTMSLTDPTMKGVDYTIFPIGGPYVRVKILKAPNMATVNTFITLLSKTLTIYSTNIRRLVREYSRFIPKFTGKPIFKISKKKIRLKDIAPDLILPGYTRKCDNPPKITNELGAARMEKEGVSIMKFPRTATEGPQNYYWCDNADNKYPGLRDNPMDNKDKYPYLPCCYPENQKDVPQSKYRQYYFGEEAKDTVVVDSTRPLITNKVTQPDKFAYLPSNIDKLFHMYDLKNTYLRKGVHRGYNSFLEVILNAMYETTGYLDADDKNAFVKKHREELFLDYHPELCKQEMYNSTDILEIGQNPEVYLSPNLFRRILEEKYGCQIIIFYRSIDRKDDGKMSTPPYLQNYYRTYTKKPIVIVYEHFGSESDNLHYPQCELIVKWSNDKMSYTMDPSQTVGKGIINMFKILTKSYSLNIPTINMKIKIMNGWKQIIDTYGKCRGIFTPYGIISTSPMAPLNLPSTRESYSDITKNDAVKLLQSVGATGLYQTDSGVGGAINNTIQTFVESYGSIDLPISDNKLSINKSEDSVLNRFMNMKKTSRYLSEYAIYLFSCYLFDNSITDITDTVYRDWIRSDITLDAFFEYPSINRSFDKTSPIFRNKKLIVTTSEMLKRLIYVIRRCNNNNRKKLLNYHKSVVIDEYYQDTSDFIQRDTEVLLFNNIGSRVHTELYPKTEPSITSPYFVNLNNTVILAQNFKNIGKAVVSGQKWVENGVNYSDTIDDDIRTSDAFTLLVKDKKFLISGEGNPKHILVGGDRFDGEYVYTSIDII